MAIRFLTAGESHGPCLSAIIEGIPYGFELDFDFINNELSSRQQGTGRGGRMKIEKDKIKILSGVRHGITTAGPIAIEIENRDCKNWVYPMSVEKIPFEKFAPDEAEKIKQEIDSKKITRFRPAHADFSGVMKYDFDDIRYCLERSSARETATRVAVGAICQNILKYYDISFSSEIIQIGPCENKDEFDSYIEACQKEGDSIGGIIRVIIKNVPVGLGSFVHFDRRLDGKLAGALMSIPAVKSVEIGLGKDYATKKGSFAHDEIYYDTKYHRKTNSSGGIEGGMTNGEDIILTVAMKPIPTIKKALDSVEMKSHNPQKAHFERADACAVDACAVVARNMSAITILDEFLDKFTHDTKRDIDEAYKNYLKRLDEI